LWDVVLEQADYFSTNYTDDEYEETYFEAGDKTLYDELNLGATFDNDEVLALVDDD